MVWYPSVDYIIEVHAILMRQYTTKERPYGVQSGALEGILDRLQYGLPMRDLGFWERTSYFLYDMINLNCFEDGNKRIAHVILERFLEKAGFMLNGSKDEKMDFILEIASSRSEEREEYIKKIQNWLEKHRIAI